MKYGCFEHCASVLHGVLEIDFYLARALCVEFGEDNNDLFFHLVLALSSYLRRGHSCLPLFVVSDQCLFASSDTEQVDETQHQAGYAFPDVEIIRACLDPIGLAPELDKALVFDNDCLFIRRYWAYEKEVVAALNSRLGEKPLTDKQITRVSALLATCYDKSAGTDDGEAAEVNWSKVAVANALLRNFTIITGGPGTGKTFAVTRLLLALQELYDGQLIIELAAPTGKAAQRLNESIIAGKAQLAELGVSAEKLNQVPNNAKTLHRLLGFRPRSVQPKFAAERLLPCDVLVLDEASMIDLPMLTRIFRATRPDAKLIMSGDPNQLPSVEVGSVLAELTRQAKNRFSPSTAVAIARLTGETHLSVQENDPDHIVTLHKSWRFAGSIGELANAVVSGQDSASWQLLKERSGSNFDGLIDPVDPAKLEVSDLAHNVSRINNSDFADWFESIVKTHSLSIVRASSVAEAFAALARFRVLAPNRVGPRGVEVLNALAETILSKTNPGIRTGQHYSGRPIMVTENNYSIRLFNGDVGLVWQNDSGQLAAFFEEGKDEQGQTLFRQVNLARLPRVETVYAMTIHKTQGSEFDQVAIVLPDYDNELLSRQLLYTAITRAKTSVSVVASQAVWMQAVQRQAIRYSGLARRCDSEIDFKS
ncbi:MAG: exodeoxyribonuclease V subunit alpha [Gammaproteobacteria bacterium]|nr:MAG: exodeoxyribonuclease V subunit alpha [Gammaproteobacteria bacterium]